MNRSKAVASARPEVRRIDIGRALLAVGLALGTALAGCGDQQASAASSPPRAATTAIDSGIPAVLATIDGEAVTMADLRTRVGDALDQNETRFRQTRSKLLEGALRDVLRERVVTAEAKKQGRTMEELIAAEAGGTVEPSDVEIATWYQENQDRAGGRPLAMIRPQIADYLRQQRRNDAIERLEARLNAARKVQVHLEPYRVTLDEERAATKGPTGAPVTLVEFSDFQCPFCGRFFPTLKRIEQQYGDRVRIVYKQFPIPKLHADAFKAAEASLCANEQGKFWELHDLMFQEQSALTVSDLKVKAGRIGLDQRKFDGCLDTGRYTGQVQEDMKEGTRVGVTGTPALFVNGVAVDGGAVSFETLAKIIDKELKQPAR